MRKVFNILILINVYTLVGCGKPGSSPNVNTPVNPVSPIPSHSVVNYVIDSSLQEPGDIPTNGSVTTAQAVTIKIPSTVTGLSNANQDSRATVNFGTFQCYYYHTA